MDLPTSLTGIGVRGVKVLPTQAKTKTNISKLMQTKKNKLVNQNKKRKLLRITELES